MVGRNRRYALADTAQQVVGGFLLAGPFVVTEEVWTLATHMTAIHAVLTVGLVGAIGYGALYMADQGRDPEREAEVRGVPVRFVSLLAVSYGSVLSSRYSSPLPRRSSTATSLSSSGRHSRPRASAPSSASSGPRPPTPCSEGRPAPAGLPRSRAVGPSLVDVRAATIDRETR